jgi:hypothetical protein
MRAFCKLTLEAETLPPGPLTLGQLDSSIAKELGVSTGFIAKVRRGAKNLGRANLRELGQKVSHFSQHLPPGLMGASWADSIQQVVDRMIQLGRMSQDDDK